MSRIVAASTHRARFILAALVFLALPAAGRAAPDRDASPAGLSQMRIAFTQANNVYLMNGLGSNRIKLTTRGTDLSPPHPVRYLTYSWSPDGRYLLLVRRDQSGDALLLLDHSGSVLRTLVPNIDPANFLPSWALDGDQIVYIAWEKRLPNSRVGRAYYAVNRVDLSGRTAFVWGFYADGYCEGFGAPPSDELYQQEMGDYYNGFPSMQWSIRRHLAVYSMTCVADLLVTDTQTGRTHKLGPGQTAWHYAAVSPSGTLAASSSHVSKDQVSGTLVLANPATGAVLKQLGPGELPVWSPDGRFVYFVRRTAGPALNLEPTIDTARSGGPMQTYTTAIWRANADGTRLLRLTSQNAFGFGPLHLTSDGRFLVYSNVDNPWGLWRHRLPGNRYDDALLRRYGPRVSIQRLEIGGQALTIAVDAGRPAAASSLGSVPAPTPSRPIVLGSKSFIRGGNGWGTVKPSRIDNNGDPGGTVQRIRWHRWGQKTAIGWGLVFIENPSGPGWGPLVRAELRATDIGRCSARGPLAYRRLYIRAPTRPGGPLRPWSNWSVSGNICRW